MVWPDMVVLSEPYIDLGLRLFDHMEPLSIQNFVAKSSIEALIISGFPSVARQAMRCIAERGDTEYIWMGLIASFTSYS